MSIQPSHLQKEEEEEQGDALMPCVLSLRDTHHPRMAKQPETG